ncbi:MAG: biotin/lipoyl-containing protein, partial [Gemmatimonadales bacterium]
MKYFVTVGTREFVVEVDGAEVRLDGQSVAAGVEHLPGTPEVRITLDGHVTRAAVELTDGMLWRLIDRSVVREVTVEDERTRHIRLLGGSARAAEGHATLKAPMPGLVLRVLVAAGDTVAAGTPLLALEAMKMENELKAAGPGVVSTVLVRAGEAVEKGQKLLEFAP